MTTRKVPAKELAEARDVMSRADVVSHKELSDAHDIASRKTLEDMMDESLLWRVYNNMVLKNSTSF